MNPLLLTLAAFALVAVLGFVCWLTSPRGEDDA
ncbi:hypothetical protein FBY23_0003 [Nocardioides sp. SLBN-35]|nr:hypothetical protein FBY23_0003 [Nocardioides sp. SLBN-35]